MAHQAAGGGLALGGQSRFIRDNWLEKIQDFPRKNAAAVKATAAGAGFFPCRLKKKNK
jgi:hypothetical protein